MPRRNPPAKWMLPDVVDPPDSICMSLQVPNNRYHIAAFRGALWNLASAINWADDIDHTAKEVAQVWRNVIDNMGADCDDATCCRDFPPSASFIEWHPQDPFTQPDFTPAGYLLPPFYLVTPLSFPDLIGYREGDVLTDITRIPAGTGVITEPTSGWSRFRINLNGTGIVNLQLLNIPLGGYAFVTVDDDPLSFSFVELNLDLIDLPPENNITVGHERRFTTEGEHHIDVTFLPRFNDELPAVFYGGGLRAVTICGFGGMVFDIRQKSGEPCIIEKTSNGIDWVDAVDMTKCPVNIRVNLGVVQWFNPITGEWEDTDGGDERYDGTAPPLWEGNPNGACLAAENITAVYQTVLTELRAGVIAAQAAVAISATITGIMSLFIPQAIVSTLALVITGLALDIGESGLDDMLEADHLEDFKCTIACNIQEDGSVTAANFTALRSGMDAWAGGVELEIIEFYLDAYGSVGLTRQGKAGGITTGDCDDCGCGEAAIWNFHTWTGADDPKVQTPLWGGSLSDTAAGTELAPNHFESEFIGGIYQGVVLVSDFLENPINTYGSEITIFAKRTGVTDFGYGHQKDVDLYVQTIAGGWGGRIPVSSSNVNEPLDTVFQIAAINLSGFTSQDRAVFYIYWGYEFQITGMFLDGVPIG